MKFNYSDEHFPPAPMVDIRLALPYESFVVGPLTAFLDTGADASVVPVRYLQPLDPEMADSKYLRSPWGNEMAVYTYVLDVEIAGLRLPSIDVVGDSVGDEVIVGRDVLNKLRITLDGPAGVIEVTG